jgi:hypothetical protein
MTRGWQVAVAAGVLCGGAWLGAQTRDVNALLGGARQALGGDAKLAAVRSLDFIGQSTRVDGDRSLPAADCEMAIELPDKFMEKSAVAQIGSTTISRTSGFNGDGVIEAVDTPPSLGGAVMIRAAGGSPPGVTPTPEQAEAMRRGALAAAHEAFARVALGVFAASPEAVPLQFSDAGQAQSPDGTADVLAVTGPDGFAARLFVDSRTHLPLMLSWMAKEPLRITRTAGPSGQPPTDAERAQMLKDAEARQRVVEYRLYYGDYRGVSGVKLPFHLQRSIDGKLVEDVTFDRIAVNRPIDPGKFAVSK